MEKLTGESNHLGRVRIRRGVLDPDDQIIGSFAGCVVGPVFRGPRQVFSRGLEVGGSAVKRQFRQRDPRFARALVMGKFSQKRLQCLGRFLVSLRRLGETFLEQQVAARFLVPAGLAHLTIIGQKARVVAHLEPGERSIKERIGGEMR